ncbi:MAG: SMC-Scp complex subunit ScpB [Candidatus Woesearchaeota archaeon]
MKSSIKKSMNEEISEDKNKIEALLFAYGKYIDQKTIAELCGIEKNKTKKILNELKEDYEKRNSALAIYQEGENWKINVREKYLSIVRKIVADTELPKSVMETLAIIAWKSPVFQSEVVKIRGNKCYDHIDLLEETGFILKEKKGRSYIIKTADKFYNYFEIDHGNLKSIFDEVKIPVKEEQKTLKEEIPEVIEIEKKIEMIETKKMTETEEEKEQQKIFLESIENKILEVKEKTMKIEEEIPVKTLNDETVQIKEETAAETSSQEKKPKSLTKKQLEKKYKEELLKIREKLKNN